MTDDGPRIVFMGTPEFAVASLRALTEKGYCIPAVVTVTDKPAGRGRKLTPSPVKEFALSEGLRVLQPEKLREPSFINTLREINADIFVVVAFRMLPDEVWSLPPMGTFNLHASLLPQYRGAAPINHAVMNGEAKTGVTTFLIDHEIDTGKILLSAETAIDPQETAGEVHDRLMKMGAALVTETVRGLAEKSLKAVPQVIPPGTIVHTAPKIFPADTLINWEDSSQNIHNKIRGLSPWPGAATVLSSAGNEVKLKLFRSLTSYDVRNEPGTVIVKDNRQLFIACGKGSVEILELQPEGRRRMTSSEFLRGKNIQGFQALPEPKPLSD
ncbi:MAG: methionyl-tRNA formyltransferase [Bacteroidales bacterium]|nr:methionyl-tRNA formyltransferase [Bacteroidales bacterium]